VRAQCKRWATADEAARRDVSMADREVSRDTEVGATDEEWDEDEDGDANVMAKCVSMCSSAA
jgi:hypothetical protein